MTDGHPAEQRDRALVLVIPVDVGAPSPAAAKEQGVDVRDRHGSECRPRALEVVDEHPTQRLDEVGWREIDRATLGDVGPSKPRYQLVMFPDRVGVAPSVVEMASSPLSVMTLSVIDPAAPAITEMPDPALSWIRFP